MVFGNYTVKTEGLLQISLGYFSCNCTIWSTTLPPRNEHQIIMDLYGVVNSLI